MPPPKQETVSLETISSHVSDSLIGEVEQTLTGRSALEVNQILVELLHCVTEEGLTAGGLDLGSLRGPLYELCHRLQVEPPDRNVKFSSIVQAVFSTDPRLSNLHIAVVESERTTRVVCINQSAIPSDGITITRHQPSSSTPREFDAYVPRGLPPNSWEYIPELIAKCQAATHDQPFEPDTTLNLLAEDLGQLGDVRNLELLLETLEHPHMSLLEVHVFFLVRAASAVDRPDLVERAYKLLPSPEANTPFLLSALIAARARSKRWAEALNEFEHYARSENPLRFINQRVCGHALNCASSAGLRDKTADILGFMRRYSIPISAIDLTVVLTNQVNSSLMLQICEDFLPITSKPDIQIFMPVLKQLQLEFQRHHQYKIRTGTVSSGFGLLRENVNKCLEIMARFRCHQNRFTYPKTIRLLSDLEEYLHAERLFKEYRGSRELSNSGIHEILAGTYGSAMRPFLLDVGHFGQSECNLHLPVHGVLEEIQRRTNQGSLKKRKKPLHRDVLLEALRAFDDQTDLLDSLEVLYPSWAPIIQVRKLKLNCERDKEAASSVVQDLLTSKDSADLLNSDDWLIATKSIAKLGDYSLCDSWIGFLIQNGKLEFAHLRELVACALVHIRNHPMNLGEKTEFLYRCEQRVRAIVAADTLRRVDDSDWSNLTLHLIKAYASIGSRESVTRLERDMRSQGLSISVEGLALFSDALLDDPSAAANLSDSTTWSEMTVLLEDVVHELNQPLLGASNSLKVLRKRIKAGVGATQLLEPIGRLEGHLERIAQRMTEYAQSFDDHDSGLMVSDFRQVLLDVLQRADERIASLGVRVGLVGPSSTQLAPISPLMLRIVLTNALRNSIEAFEEAKTKDPTITLLYGIQTSASSQRKKFYFTVTDNGPGIPKDKLELVWKRGVSTKAGRGLGIGLPLMRSIIERAGGSLQIESPAWDTTQGTRLIARL
jgi:signal transduction histidine kinase